MEHQKMWALEAFTELQRLKAQLANQKTLKFICRKSKAGAGSISWWEHKKWWDFILKSYNCSRSSSANHLLMEFLFFTGGIVLDWNGMEPRGPWFYRFSKLKNHFKESSRQLIWGDLSLTICLLLLHICTQTGGPRNRTCEDIWAEIITHFSE